MKTSKGEEFRFAGISDTFTRKLYEWEESRGIAPESSTLALLSANDEEQEDNEQKGLVSRNDLTNTHILQYKYRSVCTLSTGLYEGLMFLATRSQSESNLMEISPSSSAAAAASATAATAATAPGVPNSASSSSGSVSRTSTRSRTNLTVGKAKGCYLNNTCNAMELRSCA